MQGAIGKNGLLRPPSRFDVRMDDVVTVEQRQRVRDNQHQIATATRADILPVTGPPAVEGPPWATEQRAEIAVEDQVLRQPLATENCDNLFTDVVAKVRCKQFEQRLAQRRFPSAQRTKWASTLSSSAKPVRAGPITICRDAFVAIACSIVAPPPQRRPPSI